MSRTIFTGLSLMRAGARIEISFPKAIHGLERAAGIARRHALEIRDGGAEAWRLELEAQRPFPAQAKAFFAELNDLPAPYPDFDAARLAPGAPLVSCIAVVNENLPFVEEQLLPSLAANSARHPIEIILVCNGSRAAAAREGVRAIRSEWGAVSKAYNAGAAAARGEFLAFFHDDCSVQDPLWIEKCLQRLARGAHAVAAEYRQIDEIGGVAVPQLPVAKCVPLVLRKADFREAGGYDERHYIGYEDLDFTLALAARGKKLVATDLAVAHFHGMSSTLKYTPVPGLADLYALSALPRFAVMRRFKEFWRAGRQDERLDALRVAMDAQVLYVLQKYRDFLAPAGGEAYARAGASLEHRVLQACPQGPEAALARFRQLDRAAA